MKIYLSHGFSLYQHLQKIQCLKKITLTSAISTVNRTHTQCSSMTTSNLMILVAMALTRRESIKLYSVLERRDILCN